MSYRSDHDRDTDPIEAGLAAYTSLDGDHQFLGRAALEERLRRSVRRNVVNVRLAGDPIMVEHPLPATVDDTAIGELRNAVWSTKLETWIGLAQLHTPYDQPGTTFMVALPDGTTTKAIVHDQPFGAIQTP